MGYLLSKSEIAGMSGISEANISKGLVDWAETQVKNRLGKEYNTLTETETFYLYEEDEDFIRLKHPNVVSVTSFTIEDVDEDGLSEADDEFYVFKEDGIIKCDSLTTYKEISITYTYGNCSVGDLDKYLHLLFFLKKIVATRPSLIPKTEISEKFGDYSVKYNVDDLSSRPKLIDEEISAALMDSEDTDMYFL